MAGRGPLPKLERARASDTRRRKVLHLPAPSREGPAPLLPPRRPDGEAWQEATRRWWRAWRRAPQAARFTELDWEHLRMLAVLVDGLYRGNLRVAGEIRLWGERFGATPADRRRLGWEVETPAGEPDPIPDEARRRRLVEMAEDRELLRLMQSE